MSVRLVCVDRESNGEMEPGTYRKLHETLTILSPDAEGDWQMMESVFTPSNGAPPLTYRFKRNL